MQEKCKCEEMSCKEGCKINHTHKGFWCEKCHPERYEVQEKSVGEDWENKIDEEDFICAIKSIKF